jgi:hypothetical protein
MPQVKFDIFQIIVSILGIGVAWLVKGGVQYGFNRVVKPRISSSMSRANAADMNAVTSESLVLQAAQMQQSENAELRKEQKELYTHLVKVATELGRAQGKLEIIQPPPTPADPFADAFMVEPKQLDALEEKPERVENGLEIMPKSQRKSHILKEAGASDDFNFGETFQQRARSSANRNRANPDTENYAASDGSGY